jgi:hypothetical protein
MAYVADMKRALGPEWLVLAPGDGWTGHRFETIVVNAGYSTAGVGEEAQRNRDWLAMLEALKLAPGGVVVRL